MTNTKPSTTSKSQAEAYYRPNPKFAPSKATPATHPFRHATLTQQKQEAERRVAAYHPECKLLWITKKKAAVAQYEEVRDGIKEPFTVWIYENDLDNRSYSRIPGRCLAKISRCDMTGEEFMSLANKLK